MINKNWPLPLLENNKKYILRDLCIWFKNRSWIVIYTWSAVYILPFNLSTKCLFIFFEILF